MYKFVLLVYFFFTITFSMAQTTAQEWYKAGFAARKSATEQAVQCFSKAIQLNNNLVDAYYYRGWCYIDIGNYAKALLDFNAVLEFHPVDAIALSSRGVAHQYLGNYNLAIRDYQASLDISKDAHTYNNLGTSYEAIAEYPKALDAYRSAIKLEPTLQEAIANAERVTIKIKDNGGNSTVSAGSLRLTSADYIALGQDAMDTGDYDFAIAQYSKAIELEPNGNTYSQRGWAKYQAGRYDNALEDFTKAIAYQQGKSKWTLNYRGMVYTKLGMYENAAKDFEDALKLDGDYGTAKQNLMWIQNKLAKKTDLKPPVIQIISPQEVRGLEIVRAEETVTIVGQATDESGIDRVYINNTLCQFNNATGEFSANVKLVAGNNKIVVVAYDTKNNKGEKSLNINKKANTTNNTHTSGSPAKSSLQEVIGTNYALLIGIDEYTGSGWNNLNNPVKDVKAIGTELRDNYNYQVEIIENPTLKEINAKLKEYLLRQYKPNDQLLIFWAGHGHYDTLYKEGFIVLKDTQKEDENSYISQTTLRNKISNITCNHIFVMLDVCFGGAFSPLAIKRGSEYDLGNISVEEFVARKIKHKTRKFVTSGGLEYVPDGRPGQHSPFARKVLETLRSYGGKDNLLLIQDFIENFNELSPKICSGEFADDAAGSDFFLIAK